jgi:protein TonB
VDLAGYRGGVSKAVARHKRYPKSALRRRLEGEVLVVVVVHKDGTLAESPRVSKSSSCTELDEEAVRMVAAAAPFDPLPDGYPQATAKLKLPITFQLAEN